MSFAELKEVCNKLIGTWYCEEIYQTYTFHLNENIFSTDSKLTIINKLNKFKSFDAHYGIGVYIGNLATQTNTTFYIDIGRTNKRYYIIEELTKNKLVLREWWMKPDVAPSDVAYTYLLITDSDAADDILKGLDLGE